MKTILHIVGNRPQFIKLSVLHKEISGNRMFSQKIIHTGQHWSQQMSGVFFSDLEIPGADLQLNCSSSKHPDTFIAQASILLQEYFTAQTNCIAFVYGDTNTTLAAALAAARTNTPLFHFEAGIRTGDQNMPEEINRILTDRLASTNYCCTQRNYSTMVAEGYGSSIGSRILLSGDLMYDAFLQTTLRRSNPTLEKNYVLTTIHRTSNILSLDNLSQIVTALNKIHNHMPVIMPLHPHTKKRIIEHGLNPEFTIIEPVGYSEMQKLLSACSYVITDSGGVSREAFFNKKRSLIIMEKPFWPEIIEVRCSINTKADASCIDASFLQLPGLNPDFSSPIFGNGSAAKFIKDDLLTCLG